MTIDDLVFADGTTRMGVLGGDAVYSAIGASIWLPDVLLCSVAGADYPVSALQDSFRLDTSAIVRRDSPSLRNWGLYERDGSRQFIFRNTASSWDDYTPEVSDLSANELRGAYFHCAPVGWERQIALVSHARSSGAAFISVDPAYQFLDRISPERLGELLRHVDAFLPSLQEVREIYPNCDPEDALSTLSTQHPHLKVIAIKLGADGCVVFDRDRDRICRVSAFPALAVDPTGAGDSFCGGFLAGYAETEDASIAAAYGAVSASFVVETEGTLGLAGVTREMAAVRLAGMGHKLVC